MISFDAPIEMIYAAVEAGADELEFGVVGLDEAMRSVLYNRHESRLAGLSPDRVLGKVFFEQVAPCMNNASVAGKYVAAAGSAQTLDLQTDYVLTLRMRPCRVKLRLLHKVGAAHRYLLVCRAQEI